MYPRVFFVSRVRWSEFIHLFLNFICFLKLQYYYDVFLKKNILRINL